MYTSVSEQLKNIEANHLVTSNPQGLFIVYTLTIIKVNIVQPKTTTQPVE